MLFGLYVSLCTLFVHCVLKVRPIYGTSTAFYFKKRYLSSVHFKSCGPVLPKLKSSVLALKNYIGLTFAFILYVCPSPVTPC